jgi:hypothetical protein
LINITYLKKIIWIQYIVFCFSVFKRVLASKCFINCPILQENQISLNFESSRPRELPPQSFMQPDVNLSGHPAPIDQPTVVPVANAQTAVTFPKRSLLWLFTNAALGGLKPAPASQLRGAFPHLLRSYAHFLYKSALVAHYIEIILIL